MSQQRSLSSYFTKPKPSPSPAPATSPPPTPSPSLLPISELEPRNVSSHKEASLAAVSPSSKPSSTKPQLETSPSPKSLSPFFQSPPKPNPDSNSNKNVISNPRNEIEGDERPRKRARLDESLPATLSLSPPKKGQLKSQASQRAVEELLASIGDDFMEADPLEDPMPPSAPKVVAAAPKLTNEKEKDTSRDANRDKERAKAREVEKAVDKGKVKTNAQKKAASSTETASATEAEDPATKKSMRAKRILGDAEAVPSLRKKEDEEEEAEEEGGIETLRDERDRKDKQREETRKQLRANKFKFLEDRLDENKRDRNHPDYDPRTIYIPQSSWLLFTPFEKQFWEIKRKCMDTVLFFRKGKFFELFETDADVGQNVLGLRVTDRASMKMCGFPDKHFRNWAAKLIQAGYKVARADQVENKHSFAERKELQEKPTERNSSDLLMKRELSKVLTPGTLVDEDLLETSNATYLLAIVQSQNLFGVCFADTSVGEFNLGFFKDDAQNTQLRTLLLRTRPRELCFKKGQLGGDVMKLLRATLTSPMWNPVKPNDALDRKQAIERLLLEHYFPSLAEWPPVLTEFKENDLVIEAFALVFQYLKDLKLDKELVSQRNFKKYESLRQPRRLVLDGKTLRNLEILENEVDRSVESTLLSVVDHCVTAFGKRLLRQWVAEPLRRVIEIEARLDAVDVLLANTAFADRLREVLASLPDLERLVSRAHACAVSLEDFLVLLDAFETIDELLSVQLSSNIAGLASADLRGLLTPGQKFPQISGPLSHLLDAFDRDKAKESKKIEPHSGRSPEYDKFVLEISQYEKQLNTILAEERKRWKSQKIEFRDNGKLLYQLEVPKDVIQNQPIPFNYTLTSETQKVKRFTLDSAKAVSALLEKARDKLSNIETHLLEEFVRDFDLSYDLWRASVACLAQVDCLLSLATASSPTSTVASLCRPQFVESATPFLDIKDAFHPALLKKMGDSFIPNSITMGKDGQPNLILLTGPNMGGKSTLLRLVAVTVIMAQLGCYVLASSCTLSPVDRIFTRLGASDNIYEHQSTFMVELQETALVLNEATKDSLIILDELGRGTSTFDGYSIAYAVIRHLKERQSRTLFSTHYHMLTEEFAHDQEVSLRHMAALTDDSSDDVTFLYKMAEGVCPKSYGLKVAMMAGIGEEVRSRARQKAEDFEKIAALSEYRNKTKQMAQVLRDKNAVNLLFATQTSEVNTAAKKAKGLL